MSLEVKQHLIEANPPPHVCRLRVIGLTPRLTRTLNPKYLESGLVVRDEVSS